MPNSADPGPRMISTRSMTLAGRPSRRCRVAIRSLIGAPLTISRVCLSLARETDQRPEAELAVPDVDAGYALQYVDQIRGAGGLMSSAVMTLTAEGALLSDLAVWVDMVTFCSISSSRDSERKCLSLSSGLRCTRGGEQADRRGGVAQLVPPIGVAGTDPSVQWGDACLRSSLLAVSGSAWSFLFQFGRPARLVPCAGDAHQMPGDSALDRRRYRSLGDERAPATPIAVVSASHGASFTSSKFRQLTVDKQITDVEPRKRLNFGIYSMSRVLIVDDQLISRMILEQLIRSLGDDTEAVSFADPIRALEWARTIHTIWC